MNKKVFHTETAYILGIIILAFGTALMERANLGVSMVVAPAYLLFLKLSPIYPFITFGVAEYMLQFLLLLLMVCVLRSFRISYLFSFVTVVFYGLMLDASMALVSLLACETMVFRILFFVFGFLDCAIGIAFLFHTYVPPEVYELFVKEISAKFNLDIGRVKTIYDCVSCAVAIILSMAFFGLGHFEGIKIGTILTALVNGTVIGLISKRLDKEFEFKDGLKLRKYFERV